MTKCLLSTLSVADLGYFYVTEGSILRSKYGQWGCIFCHPRTSGMFHLISSVQNYVLRMARAS